MKSGWKNTKQEIILSRSEYKKLKDLIHTYKTTALDQQTKKLIVLLKEKLKKARIKKDINLELVDIVAINSAVRYKNLSTKEEKEYLIVDPRIECKSLGRISIISDLGIALLGRKKGNIVEVKEAGKSKYTVQILKIQSTLQEWIGGLENKER